MELVGSTPDALMMLDDCNAESFAEFGVERLDSMHASSTVPARFNSDSFYINSVILTLFNQTILQTKDYNRHTILVVLQ